MSEDTTPDATVFTCPMSKCRWQHTHLGGGIIGSAATEKTLHDHLSAHDLPEWVAEVVRLRGLLVSVIEDLAEDPVHGIYIRDLAEKVKGDDRA